MPFVTSNNTRIFWRTDGDAAKPALLLSNSLGSDHMMWQPMIALFLPHFYVIRYDVRGHGASDAPPATPEHYNIDQLGRDALAVADAAGAQQFAFAGLSMGGGVGQWLGANAGARLTRLALLNTAAVFDAAGFDARIGIIRQGGMAAVTDTVIARFMGEAQPPHLRAARATVRDTLLRIDPEGYCGCCMGLRDLSQGDGLISQNAKINTPTLVIAGALDLSTTPAKGQALAASIKGAQYAEIAGCAHLSAVQMPVAVGNILLPFLLYGSTATGLTDQARYERGIAERKHMLGAAYVEDRMKNSPEFAQPFQEFITRYAWGDLWQRPGLDERTRRLIVLAVTLSLGRWEEFSLHAKAGLAHEMDPEEARELVMQAAIYAGVPAANTAMKELLGLMKS